MFFLVFVLFLSCFSNWRLSASHQKEINVKIGLKIGKIGNLVACGDGV